MTKLLIRRDVEEILTMEDAIRIVEEAFRQLALGNVVMPQRVVTPIERYGGIHVGMPAYIGEDVDALALKIVTAFPGNPTKYNLPTVIGTLLLNDPKTGAPLAIMDAGYLTAVRTGAASGVATRYLAREKASTVGVFGAGVQAYTQLWAMSIVRRLDKVAVYDIDIERAEAFSLAMREKLGIPVSLSDSPREAIDGMDIVVAATSSKKPIFDGEWLAPGTHINAIGSHAPDIRELDTRTVARSRIIPDLKSACLSEAGDLIIPLSEGAIVVEDIGPNLGEVVARLKPGRESHEEITLFKSVGLAIQDVSVAKHVYLTAIEKGLGQEISF